MTSDIRHRETCRCGASVETSGYVTSVRAAYESFRDLHADCRKPQPRVVIVPTEAD